MEGEKSRGSYLPSFFTKLESTSPMVISKKQEIIREADGGNAQPGTEIFSSPAVTSSSNVNHRNPSYSDPASNLGLEDIIRKALMGSLDERPDEQLQQDQPGAPTSGNSTASMGGITKGQQEASPSPNTAGKQKLQSKANSRKSKSTRRCRRSRWSEMGEGATTALRTQASRSSRAKLAAGNQNQPGGAATPVVQTWEREPPLLLKQYETLSDSDD